MPFLYPLVAIALATAGWLGGAAANGAIIKTSDGTVDSVGNRALAGGAALTAASAAALVMGGPLVAAAALGFGVSSLSAVVTGARVKFGDAAEAAKLVAMVDPE